MTSTCLLAVATGGLAQDGEADAAKGGLEEIIVTARKREETLISVPTAIAAVGAQELSRSGINGIDALALKVPGFVVGEGGGTVQGGSISLRGISAADSNPLGDQAVSFNFDGVQVARASVRRMGDFDVAQVEILKGPQALFYGKNSPGGIVSMRSADPGDRFEVGGRMGYEINAEEVRGEAYISGPLSEGFGARLALYGSDMRGWVENVLPASDPFAPADRWGPQTTEFAGRVTLKYDNDGPFRARVKIAYGNVEGDSSAANYQNVDCPGGALTSVGRADDCKADDRLVSGVLGPDFARAIPAQNLGGILSIADYGNGVPEHEQKQLLSGVELNYAMSNGLTVTSVTGLYDLDLKNRANFTATANPAAILGSINALQIQEISEELRLTSDFDGRINFMVGAQYQDSKAESASVAAFGAIAGQASLLSPSAPLLASSYYLDQDGRAYSAFAQVTVEVTPELELSLGGRYSEEE
ncbi:MAG: TonB-dependent receptor, partial [Pseudomonadota bacterium]|nr:TonB-dependent receptor [Pseudomonadota bacterium]